ncbi:extra-large G-protein 1 [Actinidia rufa]|uniref:Extra-large G-protein 1 n=1 Tax=Actinidia rufa TaxID=165716 RepID=A0A7J0ET36_9ERIC|nr:extra-large G-protein 1 [Actinidia rufa]
MLPISSSKNLEDDEDYSVEYSFAVEYSGPPVSYNIPQAVPVDIDRIPTASVVSMASISSNLSLPVIQPITKGDPLKKKLSKKFKLSSEDAVSPKSASHSIEFVGISCKSMNLSGRSGEIGLVDVDECMPKVLHGVDSSGTLGFSDSLDNSQELSGSSEVEDLKDDDKEGWDLGEEELSSALSSKIGEESIDGSPRANRASSVTFGGPESSDGVHEQTDHVDPEIFKEKSKRGILGKCPRVLRKLLTDSEAKQIMRFEISCELNQIPPWLVYVNGKPLSHEELDVLRTCQYPPKKLKPGKYWYDKVSGYWGKEGQKPCQIISAQLAVGDAIDLKASNGNTNIRINNREITKVELRMLQWARINCEGRPHFWVSEAGCYQEEGQKNVIIERIWDKTGIKLVCAFLSLPIPPESANPSGDEVVPKYSEQKTLNKLLLVGCNKSGTSTIFKQARMVYNVHFSDEERQSIKLRIQSSFAEINPVLQGVPVRSMKKNRYSIGPRLKAFSDWLQQVMMSGNLEVIFPAASRVYQPLVEEFWNDRALQATYNRRNELDTLPRLASYFLDRAVEISRTDYEPSDMDILYAEGIHSSNGLSCMEFSFSESTQDSFMDPADQIDLSQRYQLIRVHTSSLGENCKWLEMFEDINLVLYCVSLTDYDQFSEDANGFPVNKMLESKKLFERIVTHPTFHQKNFLLILNKFDLLEEQIKQVPLTQCEWFDDFNPVISHNPNSTSNNSNNTSLAHRAFYYIAVKFKTLFYSLTRRKLYVSLVTGLEPDSVDGAFRYAREILKWGEEKPIVTVHDWSSGSIEVSSSS